MTVTRKEFADHLADSIGLSHRECAKLVDGLFSTIRATLAAGEDVKLSGFGNFTLHDKRARPGRVPRTGELWEITARRVVTFKASPTLRQHCNPHLQDEEA